MHSRFGPLDQMLGILLETWNRRYNFEMDRDRRVALFTGGGMQAGAGEIEGGLIRVAYESAPHEIVEEFCSPEQAAALIDAIMARKQLCRIPKPTGQPGTFSDHGKT
ncbi:MAG: hypothetical protein JO112_20340 [Planctomycetes bacterium]|nr:hypothetical protein [Planctomycetota bacterium]